MLLPARYVCTITILYDEGSTEKYINGIRRPYKPVCFTGTEFPFVHGTIMNVLHIKNMVCGRCIRVVNEELQKLGLDIRHIELGKVETTNEVSADLVAKIRTVLEESGFELLDDKKAKIIEQIKTLVINKVHYNREKQENINFSDHLEKEIGMDYSYLSSLFSSVEGTTIEKYMILQKIELVKELLVYDELSLSEIAFKMGYSSVAHLSSQFKKVTGLTPSHFKEVQEQKRKPLDKI